MLRLAIAGDLHGQWDQADATLLQILKPDALLVVGDLADGDVRLPRLLRELELPVACVLGNHDAARDASGRTLELRLPGLDPHGLYYSAVLAGDQICATYCADVSIVCQNLP